MKNSAFDIAREIAAEFMADHEAGIVWDWDTRDMLTHFLKWLSMRADTISHLNHLKTEINQVHADFNYQGEKEEIT